MLLKKRSETNRTLVAPAVTSEDFLKFSSDAIKDRLHRLGIHLSGCESTKTLAPTLASRTGRSASLTGRSSVRERLRQPEPWEHAVVEARHGADPIAREGEDEEAGPVADAAGGSAKVRPERRLTIRSRRHEVMRSAAHETGAEAGRNLAAVVFEGNWWHGNADIGGEQSDQRVDITGLP